ncbi:rRNA pseudouridine synthase [Candidatus Sumerlaeota bacterium]|nr:rRNA pseudouridine synthase [Candidatus Sumerlaeota bacterium]
MGTRLVRYLAQCGVASRRGAADLVRQGVVSVNGEIATNVALSVEPTDQVAVRGKEVRPAARTTVLMLHKPAGVVCSRRDPHNPDTVIDLIPAELRPRLKPVGRLDKDTTGLLLLTDDGDLAFRLTHPRYGIEKTYVALVEGGVAPEEIEALREGVHLEEGWTAEAKVRILDEARDRTTLEIRIHEGRKRQVRRMCEKLGHRVVRLERTEFGPLKIGRLQPGASRELTPKETASLRQAVGLADELITTHDE